MKFQTKLTLCKAVFIFIAIVVCALWAFEFRIAAVVVLLIDYIFDFITRRCPFCGKHFSIVLTVKDRCPFFILLSSIFLIRRKIMLKAIVGFFQDIAIVVIVSSFSIFCLLCSL